MGLIKHGFQKVASKIILTTNFHFIVILFPILISISNKNKIHISTLILYQELILCIKIKSSYSIILCILDLNILTNLYGNALFHKTKAIKQP
ncbi:hypothetical protein J2772_004040 [Chryseobacterium jejuense]|nr:hypothetical protein [Chryseobacterium jejuense]